MVQTRTDLNVGFVEQLRNTGLQRSYCATLLNTKQGRRAKCFGSYETETRIEYAKRRNQGVKEYRKIQNDLVAALDDALPHHCTRSYGAKGVGKRALGKNGRSLLLVLQDTVNYLRELREAGVRSDKLVLAEFSTADFKIDQGLIEHVTPAGDDGSDCDVSMVVPAFQLSPAQKISTELSPPPAHLPKPIEYCEALLDAKNLFVLQLENPWAWIITKAGRGAREFFKDAPSEIAGESFFRLMHCEDMPAVVQSWPTSRDKNIQSQVHAIDFSAAKDLEVNYIDRMFDMGPADWESHCLLPMDLQYKTIRFQMIPIDLHANGEKRVGDCAILLASLD